MESTQSAVLQRIAAFKKRMAVSVIGQEQLIDDILIAYIAGGHVLLEGAPGLAKTLAVKTFAEISGLDFKKSSMLVKLEFSRINFSENISSKEYL